MNAMKPHHFITKNRRRLTTHRCKCN